MRDWAAHRWGVAVLAATIVALVTGLPTEMVANPWFMRMTPVLWWNRPVWLLTAALSGLLLATYVADGPPSRRERSAEHPEGPDTDSLDATARRGGFAGVLGYLAIGCPVCNKIVVLALGASGAMSWFAPLQPILAVASLGLLVVALRSRLRSASVCPVVVSIATEDRRRA